MRALNVGAQIKKKDKLNLIKLIITAGKIDATMYFTSQETPDSQERQIKTDQTDYNLSSQRDTQ